MIHDERIETMRDNYDDHGAELVAKDAEIERLRELLREMVKLRYYRVAGVEELLKRVREALGDEAELAWLQSDYESAKALAKAYREEASKYRARLQVLRKSMRETDWLQFVSYDKPEAAEWFDEDGVPK